jgi:hypothetical protein
MLSDHLHQRLHAVGGELRLAGRGLCGRKIESAYFFNNWFRKSLTHDVEDLEVEKKGLVVVGSI